MAILKSVYLSEILSAEKTAIEEFLLWLCCSEGNYSSLLLWRRLPAKSV